METEGLGGREGSRDNMVTDVLSCFFSSFLAGLFGVGGGAVTIPALTMCLEMSHYQVREEGGWEGRWEG